MTLSASAAALLALAGTPASPKRAEAPTAAAFFVRAATAEDHLRFGGVRNVEILQGAIRRTHTEYILRNGPNTRVWFPADSPLSGQVIVETPSQRLHYYPRRHVIEKLPPKREEAYARLRQWLAHPNKNIRMSVQPGGKVAGRSTHLGVIADAMGNARQRIWCDDQTGMVLKRELLDNVGARAGFFEFTEIDYSPKFAPGDFAINVKGARILTLEDKVRELSANNGMIAVLIPPGKGFQLDGANILRPAGYNVMHESYMGSRGQLSLFEVAGNVDLQSFKGAARRGVSYYAWQALGHSFALVGNYPNSTLVELARVVQP